MHICGFYHRAARADPRGEIIFTPLRPPSISCDRHGFRFQVFPSNSKIITVCLPNYPCSPNLHARSRRCTIHFYLCPVKVFNEQNLSGFIKKTSSHGVDKLKHDGRQKTQGFGRCCQCQRGVRPTRPGVHFQRISEWKRGYDIPKDKRIPKDAPVSLLPGHARDWAGTSGNQKKAITEEN